MMERKNLFPERLSKRVVGGHVLYSPVVTVVAGKLIFVSGLLARNHNGEIVGKGDMGAQIRQVGEIRRRWPPPEQRWLILFAPRPSPPTSMNSSSMSTCGWSIWDRRYPPAQRLRCSGFRTPIFSWR